MKKILLVGLIWLFTVIQVDAIPIENRPFIKSIQETSLTVGAGGATSTWTINKVVTANSILIFNGISSASDIETFYAYAELTNATTVTAYHTAGQASTINLTLIEFQPGVIKFKQEGTIAIANLSLSNTATLSNAIDTSKSIALFGGVTPDADNNFKDFICTIRLTNSTTVQAGRESNAGIVNVHYTVIEFNDWVKP